MRARPWIKHDVASLVTLTLDGVPVREIARRLRRATKTIRDMQVELELVRSSDVRKRWTPAEIDILRENYPHQLTATLAQQLGKSVSSVYGAATKHGLSKTGEFRRSAEACILRRDPTVGMPGRFKPGIIPHNKGMRRPGYAPGRMRETQFKKGERRGMAVGNWKPVGTILPDDEGYLRIKVRESNSRDITFGFGNVTIWPMMQRQVWQQHNGPIPPSHAICFKDGDRKNCAIENLELVSRAELMRRNTIHTRYPKEMVNAIMLLGAVKRRLRERNAKEHDDRPAQPPL